ncbi:hypothetical protein DFH07DRAFT_842090, partial [Mycena maculata]
MRSWSSIAVVFTLTRSTSSFLCTKSGYSTMIFSGRGFDSSMSSMNLLPNGLPPQSLDRAHCATPGPTPHRRITDLTLRSHTL